MPAGGPAYRAPGARPFGLTLMIIFQTLLGLLSLVFGLFVLLFMADDFAFSMGGIALIVVGFLFLYSSYGMNSMQPMSWMLSFFGHILNILGYVFFMIATGMPPQFGIGQMIISMIIIIYLITPTTRALFGY